MPLLFPISKAPVLRMGVRALNFNFNRFFLFQIDKLRSALKEFFEKADDRKDASDKEEKTTVSPEQRNVSKESGKSRQGRSKTKSAAESKKQAVQPVRGKLKYLRTPPTPHGFQRAKSNTPLRAKSNTQLKAKPSTPLSASSSMPKRPSQTITPATGTPKGVKLSKGPTLSRRPSNRTTPKQMSKVSTNNVKNVTPRPESSLGKRKSSETKGSDKKKVRRGTFECEPTPELNTPEIPTGTKRQKSSSPGTKELVASMKSNMTGEEMKKSLMAAIDDKIKRKSASSTENKAEAKETQIPRFMAFLAKRKQESQTLLSPGTKRYNKVHKREFEKMESIDDYLERKRRRKEEMSSSVKKTQQLLEETRMTMKRLQDQATQSNTGAKKHKAKLFPTPGSTARPAPFKPSVLSTKEMNLNFGTKTKTPQSSGRKPFKPSVISTKEMNLNFSKVTTPQTVPRASPRNAIKKENQGSASIQDRKSTGSTAPKKTASTPFKFTATLNSSMNVTMSAKKSFDLKASLARPITWKAHKGKLKPFKSNQTSYGSTPDANATICLNTTTSRHARMTEQSRRRDNSKFNSSVLRRGIQA
ncbi:hypothetical protein FSP39_012635 [Pinctada imbricata]|uniref:Uncharacterized protein n=1 Tax=Pinctada imbricata TaxID=66713 RepID=A0AA89C3E9_PINIB|nr:hypothetical protein FSP39_012635 [Pinctada imbricata]